MSNRPEQLGPSAVRPSVRGFTLIELIVTVVVLAVALAVAVPSFANLVRNQRLTGTANDLAGALARARSEAIATGSPTRLCPSTPATAGNANPCTGGTDYAAGWVVVVDANGNGAINTAGADRLVRFWRGPDYPIAGFAGPNDVTYDNQGLKIGGGTDNFDLRAAGCAGPPGQRTVSVNAAGNFDTVRRPC